MPTISAPAKVLVTGANGFIGAWVVKDLLDHGYSARAAARSLAKTKYLGKLFSSAVAENKLEFTIVPNFTEDGAFDEAVKGVDAILHIASSTDLVEDPDGRVGAYSSVPMLIITLPEIIRSASKSTLGMLNSARNYGYVQSHSYTGDFVMVYSHFPKYTSQARRHHFFLRGCRR